MLKLILKVHPEDNIIVALSDLQAGTELDLEGEKYLLAEDIPVKHKFAGQAFQKGDPVIMYGVLVGKATRLIPKGARISQENVSHAVNEYGVNKTKFKWNKPEVSKFRGRTFLAYHREDGKVGTANYWLVIPLVFCENRNIEHIKQAMTAELGYRNSQEYKVNISKLIQLYQNGESADTILDVPILQTPEDIRKERIFQNVDGIKFLTHEGGCGGIRQDAEMLCKLLAGYITHPNVAGATILSLGCQMAEIKLLKSAIRALDSEFSKPLFFLEQQKSKSEPLFIADAIKKTFVGLIQANQIVRKPAPLSKLCIGLECGGSDGFSGISANPALGYASDLLVALGGKAILAEFPELNGAEQDLINRCVDSEIATKFSWLMKTYARRAKDVGSGFDMNPSPGNIKDGLITDAMKSAGAVKKGGTSPVVDVLDYAEPARKSGLNLLCTPGNDVESTTGLAGSWANIIVFTTGLGTPTGNPVAPTIKISSNTELAKRMPDLIDLDTGTIITCEDSIESKGEELLELIIKVASGEVLPNAVRLGQDDFIPWKRGISL